MINSAGYTVDPGLCRTHSGSMFVELDVGTAVTDADGAFATQVTMPTDVAVGSNNLVASGVDAAGSTRLIWMPVTVAAATSLPTLLARLPPGVLGQKHHFQDSSFFG